MIAINESVQADFWKIVAESSIAVGDKERLAIELFFSADAGLSAEETLERAGKMGGKLSSEDAASAFELLERLGFAVKRETAGGDLRYELAGCAVLGGGTESAKSMGDVAAGRGGAEWMPLGFAGMMEKYVVREVGGGGRMSARMAEMGLTAGTELQVVGGGGGGPLIVSFRDSRMALGRGMAMKVMVSRLNA